MPWDEEAFKGRILARASALGLSEREVMRRAGRAEDTFNKPPGESGRTYNLIESIAAAVGMTVAEAIGQARPLLMPILEQAVECAFRATPSDRYELLPDAIASAYEILAQLDHERLPIDDSARRAVEASVRQNIRRRT